MTYELAATLADELTAIATPVLRVDGYDPSSPRWCRDVAPEDDRRGPWHAPVYTVVDKTTWETRAPCVYIVDGSDGGHRYVGISKNRLKDRWRVSPALDESGSRPLGTKHLFHNRCWPEMEREFDRKPGLQFNVRVAFVPALRLLASKSLAIGSALPTLSDIADADVPGAIEKWLRGYRRVTLGASFLPWNKN